MLDDPLNPETSSTPDYTMGFSEAMLQFLERHTLESNAAYLVPYLKPGMRALDFGCGPGTISVGLARAVAPGALHGVDMEESQVERARAVAQVSGQDNAVFHVADATDMPFEDDYFDVAHAYNVLMHVPDTAALLAEVKRVLKPGGVLGCRELICDSSFTHPDFDYLQRGWEVFRDLVAADDGHPQMGKHLKTHLLEAGFADVQVRTTFNSYSSPEDLDYFHAVVRDWFLSPEIREAATKYGAATPELFDNIRKANERWRAAPGAIVGMAYGEAIAHKAFA